MELLSREYGWLPSQIRKESYDDIISYIDIISMRNLIEKANNKKNGRK
jgi:hypothetical protein